MSRKRYTDAPMAIGGGSAISAPSIRRAPFDWHGNQDSGSSFRTLFNRALLVETGSVARTNSRNRGTSVARSSQSSNLSGSDDRRLPVVDVGKPRRGHRRDDGEGIEGVDALVPALLQRGER